MPRHGWAFVCVMVAMAALGGGDSPSAAEPAPGGATPEAGTPVTGTPVAGTPVAPGMAVVSRDIYFDPDGLAIPANTDIALLLPNEGKALHSFTIDALGIDVYIAPESEGRVVINAAPGTYRFYCAVYGHATAGMVGELTIR